MLCRQDYGTDNMLIIRKNILKPWMKLALVGVTVGTLVLWQTAYWSHQITLDQIGERSRHTLNLIVQSLRGDLSKFTYLPQMLGANEGIRAALRGTLSATGLQNVNEELERINNIAGSLDTYLMNTTGLTVAASNWASDKTFIGKNFNYRPYFKAAMEGRLGRYFAVGTTSGERGYYFAYPVRDGTNILGVAVVKIQVDHHENGWRVRDQEVIVVDNQGVIFLSSEPSWRFKTLTSLSDELLTRLSDSRRYSNKPLTPLILSRTDAVLRDGERVVIEIQGEQGQNIQEPFLVHEESMADAGWRIMLLARTARIDAQFRLAMAAAGVLLVSILLAAAAIYQRRRRLADRIAVREESLAQLEQRVYERTNDLTQMNVELQNEIVERKRAEEEVRKAQVSLVQTAKLAALGQMSAGLSHELNQPLAAIRSYADNARTFLDRKQQVTAKQNLKGISDLTDRMARIIRNLRTYAREENIELRSTSLGAALDQSLNLMDTRIHHENVTIVKSLPDEDVSVMAGDVRLQQIFVNLISNALDAMQPSHAGQSGRNIQDETRKKIHITVSLENGTVIIIVRDTGPGIQHDQINNVFDPFYSTKEVGQGMGLGLSITFGLINQFGGTIVVHNAPDGGAVFTLKLIGATS